MMNDRNIEVTHIERGRDGDGYVVDVEFCGIGIAGVGVVLYADDDLVAIDLDRIFPAAAAPSVRAGDLSPLPPWARRLIRRCASYTEISPSGAGIHIFLRAALPTQRGHRGRSVRLEAYDRNHTMSVTGDHIAGTPTTIHDRQTEIDRVVAPMLPHTPPPQPVASMQQQQQSRWSRPQLTDREILDHARAHPICGHKFASMFDFGDISRFDGDASAADFSLCYQLSFATGGDCARVDSLFRQSALFRPAKWDSRRRDSSYGRDTVSKAVASEQRNRRK
jgi:putative DNA primase/helicase